MRDSDSVLMCFSTQLFFGRREYVVSVCVCLGVGAREHVKLWDVQFNSLQICVCVTVCRLGREGVSAVVICAALQ